jgi:CDP-glycerol glycerophosphotransferase (TagB/SpsB family)
VRSHGDGDLDDFLVRWFRPPGTLFYVNHCLSFLKPLGKSFPSTPPRFDWLLACSELERQNFLRCFPGNDGKVKLGGGAHIDALLTAAAPATNQRTVLYFPTYRDKQVRSNVALDDVIEQLSADPSLLEWLHKTDRTLCIASHVNTMSSRWKSERVEVVGPEELADRIARCEVFVSDYSGTIGSALAVEKPVIFFPFDLDDYLKVRVLYQPYEEYLFGPRVDTVEQLVACLVNEKYADLEAYREMRDAWRSRLFVSDQPDYAARSHAAIEALVAQGSA